VKGREQRGGWAAGQLDSWAGSKIADGNDPRDAGRQARKVIVHHEGHEGTGRGEK